MIAFRPPPVIRGWPASPPPSRCRSRPGSRRPVAGLEGPPRLIRRDGSAPRAPSLPRGGARLLRLQRVGALQPAADHADVDPVAVPRKEQGQGAAYLAAV